MAVAIYFYLAVIVSTYFLILTFYNLCWFAYSKRAPLLQNGKKISIIIPCRNEEHTIGACFDSILKQRYQNYEILAFDDNSEDNTWKVLCEYANRYPKKISVFREYYLPDGWNGKPYGLHFLTQKSTGAYLLFTDADARYHPLCINVAMGMMQKNNADGISGYVRQKFAGFFQTALGVAMYINQFAFIPFGIMNKIKNRYITQAIGQFFLLKREVYTTIGGWERCKQEVCEDVAMSRFMKDYNYYLLFVDLKKYLYCLPPEDSREWLRRGLTGFFNTKSVVTIGGIIIVYFLFIVFPWLLAILHTYFSDLNLYAYNMWLPPLIGLSAWTLTLLNRGQRWYTCIFYPFTMLYIVAAMIRMFISRFFTKERPIAWKGRDISINDSE